MKKLKKGELCREHKYMLRKLGLAAKNFEFVSHDCSDNSFRHKKTGAILNIRW